MGRGLLVFLFFSSFVAFGEPSVPQCSDKPSQFFAELRRLGKYVSAEVQSKLLLDDPRKSLRPGDIIILAHAPGISRKDQPGSSFMPYIPGEVGDLPDPMIPEDFERQRQGAEAFVDAMEKFPHAAVVGISKKKGEPDIIYHLDSPYQEKRSRDQEFLGNQPYFVVRPKTPPGETRESFEKRLNQVVEALADVGWEYDHMMNTPFLKKGVVAQVQQAIDQNCLKRENVPDLYCSGLTQMVVAVAGGSAVKPVTLGHLIDTAAKEIKKDPANQSLSKSALTEKAVEKALKIVEGFVHSEDPRSLIDSLKEGEAEVRRLEEKLKDNQLTDFAREELEAQRTAVAESLSFLAKDIERVRQQNLKAKVLKTALEAAVRARISGNPDYFSSAIAAPILGKEIVRPIEILRNAVDPKGDYELVGFYPGHLPRCTSPEVEISGDEARVLPSEPPPKRIEHLQE